jgi:hypothetical protein
MATRLAVVVLFEDSTADEKTGFFLAAEAFGAALGVVATAATVLILWGILCGILCGTFGRFWAVFWNRPGCWGRTFRVSGEE